MAYIDFVMKLHKSTKRDYVQRVVDHDKAECAKVAIEWGKDMGNAVMHAGTSTTALRKSSRGEILRP